MTCAIPNGMSVHFLKSGIAIEAIDVTTRTTRSRYAYSKIKVSKPAGQLVQSEALNNEPVELRINGVLQDRYMYDDTTLDVGRDEAWFKLWDARKVLDRGVLTQHWDELTVEDALTYIFENREDPHTVLTGWRATDPAVLAKSKQDAKEDIVEAIHGVDADADRDGFGGFVNDTIVALGRLAEFLGGSSQGLRVNKFKSFELEDVSPNTAIRRVEETFGFTSWVDRAGVLWIGYPEGKPGEYHAVKGTPTDSSYAMSQYNVTTGSGNVSRVMLDGKTHWYGGNRDGNFGADPTDELYPIAEAWDPENTDGITIAPEEPRNIWELESLESAAIGILVRASMEYRNGNIVFNGAASDEKAKLAQMSVGDVILVSDNVEHHCTGDVDGGSFIVTEVQHTVNARQGWKVTVEVGSVPTNIKSTAMYYSATNDQKFSTLASYESG